MPAQPEVAFHFNVADPLRYLCRLLRKVHQAGMSALVCVPPALARELDQALWTFAAEEFIPHAGWSADELVQARTPILIDHRPELLPARPLLFNWTEQVASGFERYERVIEIVDTDPDMRARARERWRAYQALGQTPDATDMQELARNG